MKTENLKKEEIYLNLAECSEEEIKELSKILNYKISEVREFPLLIFEGGNLDQYETGFHKLKNKTEVNFKEFKEIMGATFEDEKVEIFDIDFGGNCMARMEIKNGKFKFTDAMNGGGFPIPIENIKITPTN